ncbi:MAG: ankyrin repeat domain-containing protein [Gammaproteobacteria bacterium]|nr:ankyrin repeat domain-containing protein [Gammaproteobacteria bacterium]MBU1481757.1 ankyrin repeat domain-containing protein [Gammaproteobacteria bacterium]
MKFRRKVSVAGLVFCFLLSIGSAVAATDDDLNLISAAGRDDLRIYTMMLAMGANPHALDKGQNTAVLMAAYYGRREMVRRLIESHVNVNILGSIGFTPLGAAAMRGDVEIVNMLIAAGARLDVHDYAGGTPLLNAIRHQRDENVKVLLRAGAGVDIADDSADHKGETPLMAAVQTGRLDYVEALLARHALTGTRNPDGNTALYYAIFEGYDEISKQLIQAGTVVRGLNNGYTLLHWAQVMGRTDIVPLLVNAGAVD